MRNSCVAMVSGAGRYQRCGFQSSADIPSDPQRDQRLIFGRAGEVLGQVVVAVQGGVPSPWRRKKWRATTPSVHLGVPDSSSVISGNGGIWQQLGWRTVCVISTPSAHTFFLMRILSACLSQPVATVVLQVTVSSSRIDFAPIRGSRTT